jgi:TPR repeat protein
MENRINNQDKLFIEADTLHEHGQYMEALALFIQGAETGDSSCMTRIALMYSCGEGVECDYDKTLEWELKAIELGDVSAMINAGITYRFKGELIKSKYWFEQALENGNSSGAIELAKLYMVSDKELDRVKEYLVIAMRDENLCEGEIEEVKQLLSSLNINS